MNQAMTTKMAPITLTGTTITYMIPMLTDTVLMALITMIHMGVTMDTTTTTDTTIIMGTVVTMDTTITMDTAVTMDTMIIIMVMMIIITGTMIIITDITMDTIIMTNILNMHLQQKLCYGRCWVPLQHSLATQCSSNLESYQVNAEDVTQKKSRVLTFLQIRS
nr:uncharacterized protein LOC110379354 [Helicoverpa armigera]